MDIKNHLKINVGHIFVLALARPTTLSIISLRYQQPNPMSKSNLIDGKKSRNFVPSRA